MYGWLLRANRPIISPLIGVSRHPRTVRPCSLGDFLQHAFAEHPLLPVHGKKNHPDSIFTRSGQRKTELGAFAVEKGMRNLNEYASAVACFRIAAAGSAMRQVNKDLDALQHDIVRLAAFDIGDKAHTTSVMLVPRVV